MATHHAFRLYADRWPPVTNTACALARLPLGLPAHTSTQHYEISDTEYARTCPRPLEAHGARLPSSLKRTSSNFLCRDFRNAVLAVETCSYLQAGHAVPNELHKVILTIIMFAAGKGQANPSTAYRNGPGLPVIDMTSTTAATAHAPATSTCGTLSTHATLRRESPLGDSRHSSGAVYIFYLFTRDTPLDDSRDLSLDAGLADPPRISRSCSKFGSFDRSLRSGLGSACALSSHFARPGVSVSGDQPGRRMVLPVGANADDGTESEHG